MFGGDALTGAVLAGVGVGVDEGLNKSSALSLPAKSNFIVSSKSDKFTTS
jgi:hypothetical protein